MIDDDWSWRERLGEFSIIDGDKSYTLVIGYVNTLDYDHLIYLRNVPYIRLWDSSENFLFGEWFDSINNINSAFLDKVSIYVRDECVNQVKRLQKLMVFS